MSARPVRQESARVEARARFRDEWKNRERRGTQREPSVRSAPRGNQEPDQGDVDRSFEKLWAVIGR